MVICVIGIRPGTCLSIRLRSREPSGDDASRRMLQHSRKSLVVPLALTYDN
jgi:hypothetical protein